MIRDNILFKRKSLSTDTRKAYSKKIIDKILNSIYYIHSKTIMCFISFSNEVDTHKFIKKAIEDGKNVLVPITFPDTKKLIPSKIEDFSELEPGFYNILTPKKQFIRFIDPKEIDLVIVPGVAFEKKGYRIGYGGGYYDRFLSQIPSTTTIAIGFDLQIVEDLPIETYDIPVDFIYTEKNIINCK